MPGDYATIFWELIHKPFERTVLIWGIVPLYFSWIVAELSGAKATFKTALQTGFNLVWAAAQWIWQHTQTSSSDRMETGGLFAVNVLVIALTLVIGLVALHSGLRHKYPHGCSFLGHSRFSSYLTITIFPIQSNLLPWSWDRLIAIGVFAVPTWLILHFGLMSLRVVKR